ATAPLRQIVVDGRAPSVGALPRRTIAGDAGPLPVIADLPGGFYLRPDPERIRIGAVRPEDETEFLTDADASDAPVPSETIPARLEAAKRRVPGLAVEGVRPVIGVYDVTVQDWYPI